MEGPFFLMIGLTSSLLMSLAISLMAGLINCAQAYSARKLARLAGWKFLM